MVQVRLSVGSAQNGSIKAVSGSGMASMSLASMLFQPRMEEPSKPNPSSNISSVSSPAGTVKCCQVPKVSTNLMSTIFAPCFFAISITLLGVFILGSLSRFRFHKKSRVTRRGSKKSSDCLLARFFGADADRTQNGQHENFSIPNLSSLRCLDNCFHGGIRAVIRKYDFQFDLGQKIDRVFAAAINFGVAFLPAETFDLRDGHALNTQLRKRRFDVFEFEWLDNRLDFFHWFGSRRRIVTVACRL